MTFIKIEAIVYNQVKKTIPTKKANIGPLIGTSTAIKIKRSIITN